MAGGAGAGAGVAGGLPGAGGQAVGAAGGLPGAWGQAVGGVVQGLEQARQERRAEALGPAAAGAGGEGRGGSSTPSTSTSATVSGAAGGARALLGFAGNDYLGLAGHPEVRRAASAAAARFGMGSRGSPLVCGHSTLHETLELELARLKRTEAAALFPSGFAANTGSLATLAGRPDAAVFSDALNHASIVDGCRLAARGGAEVRIYRHLDLAHLEELLEGCTRPLKLVVTDSVFSMDGDLADLRGLARLRKRHGFLLVVDEAHGTLVFGEGAGGGAVQAASAEADVDLAVGTLSKAFGAQGGFVACSALLKRLLVSRARSYIFSTALPLPSVAAALASLRVARQEGDGLRARLTRNACLLRELLGDFGSSRGGSLTGSAGASAGQAPGGRATSPIIPIVIGSEEAALRASAILREQGFHVPAIRPPTVAPGTCRLRIALSAAHSERDVRALAAALLVALPAAAKL